MDVVLELMDSLVFDRLYAAVLPRGPGAIQYDGFQNTTTSFLPYHWEPASQYLSMSPSKWVDSSRLPRDDPWRQMLSLYMITCIFGTLLYFIFATASYYLVFDHATFNHPKYLKNQVSLEIRQSLASIPGMALLTAPCFWLEVRGYSKMYDTTADGPGLWYNYFQFPLFLMFTDCGIYYIHRGLHHPRIYKHMHKAHHKWIMPTPFAAIAFHPVDGFAQSLPYHLFPLIFPLQKWAYVLLFTFIQIWTIMIHDGEYVANNPVINGAACHSIHHSAFSYNYGQFTTLWDRLGGSYRKPDPELFEKEKKMSRELWAKHSEETDQIIKNVEGDDDRSYLPDAKTKKSQ